MLRAHIIEREDRKTLNLLGFALERASAAKGNWAAGYDRADLGPVDDATCLWREDGAWIVAYTERGTWTEIGRFPLSHTASRFLFTQICGASSPYDVREHWEFASGLSFSMVD